MSPGGDGDGAVCLLIYRNYVYPTFGSGRLYSESSYARTHALTQKYTGLVGLTGHKSPRGHKWNLHEQ